VPATPADADSNAHGFADTHPRAHAFSNDSADGYPDGHVGTRHGDGNCDRHRHTDTDSDENPGYGHTRTG
jgi:hypothetical protein